MLAKQTEKELESPKFIKSLAILSCLSFLCLQFALSFLFTFALIAILSGRLFLQSARKLKKCGMIFFLPKIILVRLFDKTILDTLCEVQQIPRVALDCMKSILSLKTQQEVELRSFEQIKNDISLQKKKMILMNVLETKGILNILPESVSLAILPRNQQNVDRNNKQCEDEDKESLASASTDTSKQERSVQITQQMMGECDLDSSFSSDNFKIVKADSNILVNSTFPQNQEEKNNKTESNQCKDTNSPYQIYNKNYPQNNEKTEDQQSLTLDTANTQEIGVVNIATSTQSFVGSKQKQSGNISKWNAIHQFRNKLKSNCIKMAHSTSTHVNHHHKHLHRSEQLPQSQSLDRKSNPLTSIFTMFRNLNVIKKSRNLTNIDNKTLIKAFLVSSLFMGTFLSTTRSIPLEESRISKKKSSSGIKNKTK